MKLTGKEVYGAYVSHWPAQDQEKFTPFDELYEDTREIYEGIARRINEAHIAPLQGVVQELLEFSRDCVDKWPEGEQKDWINLYRERETQAQALLPRKHQYRLKRNYQFPNATSFIQDGQNVGWVVNTIYQKNLYGVVRYLPHGDDVAWIESESFGTDKEQAEAWIKEQLKLLREEQSS